MNVTDLLAKLHKPKISAATGVRAADEIIALRQWIRGEGVITDTCTYTILHERCEGCRCGKKIAKGRK